MLNAKRGEAMECDDLPNSLVGDFDVRCRERHSAGESEIDEIPIDRLRLFPGI